MSVTPSDIGAELVPPRTPSDAEAAQWGTWIDDALLLIELRAKSLGKTMTDLDGRIVDYVVRKAVAAFLRNPDGATQSSSTISIDDGSRTISRSYGTGGNAELTIIEDWWRMLGLAGGGSGQAFAIDTIGAVGLGAHSPICSLVFGATYCSCAADLTLAGPLYEIEEL